MTAYERALQPVTGLVHGLYEGGSGDGPHQTWCDRHVIYRFNRWQALAPEALVTCLRCISKGPPR